jgi:hypothetical protein
MQAMRGRPENPKIYCVVVSTGAVVWASAVCAGVCWFEAWVEE